MENLKFEEALAQLEQVVRRLESGETSLEESLELFETGVKLARICNQKLDEAEAKIEVLVEKHGELVREPFVLGEENDED